MSDLKNIKSIWKSPSNIALIKYWGKHGLQLPNNPSLSMTLDASFTQTSVQLKKRRSKKQIEIDFYFEEKKQPEFAFKIEQYFLLLMQEFPWLKKYRIEIKSENSFPHSAGIASSASSMSALALCLSSIHLQLGFKKTMHDFYESASNTARIGSGSASRSLFGEFCVWGETKLIKAASNQFAIAYPDEYHSEFKNLQDTILLVDDGVKSVSSRAGHTLMEHHPMSAVRYQNAHQRLKDLLLALKLGDWNLFTQTIEIEALELHALMMTSTPSFILMAPESLAIIEKIRRFRNETKIPVCFTLDAGPNVHVLYADSERKKVRNFIQSELLPFCIKKKCIYDRMGKGPSQIIQE